MLYWFQNKENPIHLPQLRTKSRRLFLKEFHKSLKGEKPIYLLSCYQDYIRIVFRVPLLLFRLKRLHCKNHIYRLASSALTCHFFGKFFKPICYIIRKVYDCIFFFGFQIVIPKYVFIIDFCYNLTNSDKNLF